MLLEGADELFSDDAALAFRVGHTAQGGHKLANSIHHDQFDPQVFVQRAAHLGYFTLAQESGIYEYCHKLLAHRTLYHGSSHAGVHPAADRRYDHILSNLSAYALHASGDDRIRRPVRDCLADIDHKAAQDF